MSLEMTERGIGLEVIERETALVLYQDLNEELIRQEEKWAERDTEWSSITGKEPSYVALEPIEEQNYHEGHRPSLIENLPEDNYPNVSVMAYRGRPGKVIDQSSNFLIYIDVEIMCKSDTSEAEVNKRTHRTVEAVHQVLVRNQFLNGKSIGWEEDPDVALTDIFKRKRENGYGEDWYWQGAKLIYSLTRHSKLPA